MFYFLETQTRPLTFICYLDNYVKYRKSEVSINSQTYISIIDVWIILQTNGYNP